MTATWALDLDGVVWRGNEAVDGSTRAIKSLQESSRRVLYVTNSSMRRSSDYVEKLAGFGIAAAAEDVVHGGLAAAKLVKPGERVLVCAGEGVFEGLEGTDAEVIDSADLGDVPPPVDTVIMAWMPDYEYRRLALATRAVLAGARLVATNVDPLYPTQDGMLPGTGALVHAVAFCTGAEIISSGKPNKPIADLVREKASALEMFVGDQPSTDGRLAEVLDVPFGLVLSGVTTKDNIPSDLPIAVIAEDLASLVESAPSAP